jgi:hypothetical protein
MILIERIYCFFFVKKLSSLFLRRVCFVRRCWKDSSIWSQFMMYQISFYVPETHLEVVKNALFDAGAGKWGNYDRCSFEYSGFGQFRALKGSHPFLGQEGKLERVSEVKVELICEEVALKAAIDSLKAHHPYETPAYFVTKIVGH